MRLITLTTDFGLNDWFVGTMKGVILRFQPLAGLIDITHQIPPGDIRAGAFALAASCRFFPRGTIHLAVVDPGVGSARAAIAVRTKDYIFVGPDNGVLALALERESIQNIRRLENKKYFLSEVSRTFHGRDVFAPVAAHLSRGVSLNRLGPECRDYRRADLGTAEQRGETLLGQIVYVDRFGNALTNLSGDWMAGFARDRATIRIGRRKTLVPFAPFYQAVKAGQPLALVGSSGYLEIAVNAGNAAQKLGLRIGDTVQVQNGSHF